MTTKTAKTRLVHLVTFGLAGHSEDYIPLNTGGLKYGKCSLSGYDSPHNWKPDECSDYSRAVVIDKREVLERDPGTCFRSPMPDCNLADGQVEACPEPSDVLAIGLATASPQGAALLGLQAAHKLSGSKAPGPLDYVSPADYAAYWQNLGAKIGTVRDDGRIIWSDGEVQPLKLSVLERAAALALSVVDTSNWLRSLSIRDASGSELWSGSAYCADAFLDTLNAPKFA